MSLSVVLAVIITIVMVLLFPQVVGFLISGAMMIIRTIGGLIGRLIGK